MNSDPDYNPILFECGHWAEDGVWISGKEICYECAASLRLKTPHASDCAIWVKEDCNCITGTCHAVAVPVLPPIELGGFSEEESNEYLMRDSFKEMEVY